MTKINEFNQKLNEIFANRTHWLRTSVKKIQGRPPKHTNSKINRAINDLQNIASEILVDEVLNKEFDKVILQEKKWNPRNKGWGRKKKVKSFDSWFEKNISYKNYIYVFKSGKKFKYVGRSIANGTRPQTHFEKYWFNDVTQIKIFSTSQRSQIPKLECLAIHMFEPSVNCNKPSFSNNDKSCPICDTEKLIKKEIKSIFKLR